MIEQSEKDNWDNIEAQLWCYSRFEKWRDKNKRVTLIGEVWRNHGGMPVRIIKPFAWEKDEPKHETKCQNLFNLYCKRVENYRIDRAVLTFNSDPKTNDEFELEGRVYRCRYQKDPRDRWFRTWVALHSVRDTPPIKGGG